MANTSNSNARYTSLDNGATLVTLAPMVQLTYQPNGTPGIASFNCTEYMAAGNTFFQVQSNPRAVIVELEDSLATCYGSQNATLTDPMTGIDLTKVSVAGILSIFQSAFDTECNVQALQKQLKLANTEANLVSFSYTANGNTLSFTSNTRASNVVSWGWILGDGMYSLDADPVHTYVTTGNVKVSFIATDASNNVFADTQTVAIG